MRNNSGVNKQFIDFTEQNNIKVSFDPTRRLRPLGLSPLGRANPTTELNNPNTFAGSSALHSYKNRKVCGDCSV